MTQQNTVFVKNFQKNDGFNEAIFDISLKTIKKSAVFTKLQQLWYSKKLNIMVRKLNIG